MSNEILAFCPTDTSTNLLTQAEYAAAANRTNGNQPGLASSKLNNKAVRQATYVASQVAQFVADTTATSVLDDNTPAKLLAQINAAVQRVAPVVTVYTSASGTHNVTYTFFIASGNATSTATYTNNAVTFTVVATVAAGVQVQMTGNGPPTASGTLTKSGGTGDATLTFYAVRAPLTARVRMVGGGGGGGGSGTADGTVATDGGDTTFSTRTAGGGVHGTRPTPGVGGTASGSGFTVLLAQAGMRGSPGTIGPSTANGAQGCGGNGGVSQLVGAGPGGEPGGGGQAAATNSGSGGGGGGGDNVNATRSGGGGGGGAYVEFLIANPTSYSYAVGAKGDAGAAGTNGRVGGDGAAGQIIVEESYQ